MNLDQEVLELASQLGAIFNERSISCVTAESCTGGLLASALTDIPGASHWFERAFVSYSNEAKTEMLSVPHDLIASHGAVSESVVRAMAHGAIAHSRATVSVAITGVAGPGGGTEEKPVGTVWIAWAGDLQPTQAECFHFEGDRQAIRQQTVRAALSGLIARCESESHPQFLNHDHARYFFALWPNAQTAQKIHDDAKQVLRTAPDCMISLKQNLHMTLVYLGNVYAGFVENALQVANDIQAQAFDMTIAHVNYWPDSQVGWFGLNHSPDPLIKLVKTLNQALIPVGFRPEKRSFIPHITIARHLQQIEKNLTLFPIHWRVEDFCLVKSTAQQGPSQYEIIARWPMNFNR